MATGHEKWIEIQSFQVGGTSSQGLEAGQRAASGPGGPGTIILKKKLDKASPLLQKAAAQGTRFPQIVLEGTKGGGGQAYLEIKLTEVLISGFQMGGGGMTPSESLSLNFTKIEFDYKERGKPPAGKAPGAAGGGALAGAAALAPPTPTATPARPVGAAPKR
jgi:type VI secretion system secreted protein Hcp